MVMTYDEMVAVIKKSTTEINSEDAFKEWLDMREINTDALLQIANDIALQSLEKMRDGEATLMEVLVRNFCTGFAYAFAYMES